MSSMEAVASTEGVLHEVSEHGAEVLSSKRRFWRRFRSNRLGVAAGSFLCVLAAVAVAAPWLTRHDPNLGRDLRDAFQGPGSEYWLGTDRVGRDIFTRLAYGARYALVAGFQAVLIALAIGVPLGLMLGYFRGWVDRTVMRLVEALVALPAVVLALAIVAVVGPGITQAMFAIGLVYSMVITRLARAEVLAVREEVYVDGARAAGAGHARIMMRHILPNVAPALIVQTTLLFATAVLAEAGLSLLGVGAASDQASWGRMLADSRESLNQSLWPAIPPGVAVFVTVLGFNMFGDGLRDAFAREARGGRLGVSTIKRRSHDRITPAITGSERDGATMRSEPEPPRTLMPTANEGNGVVPLLAVGNLTVSFPSPGSGGRVDVLQQVSFEVQRGEVLALVGESGSGKSMTALSILGLVPEPGTAKADFIRLDGCDLVGLEFERLRRLRGQQIGVIFQEPSAALNPAFTVGRQISEGMRAHLGLSRKAARARAIELLHRVGIPQAAQRLDDYPHQFSGGMAQRVVIAMALSCEPRLLIADEPTTALDVTVQGQVLDLIGELSSEFGLSVLLITHDLGVVSDLADRAAVMYAGEIVEAGRLEDLYHRPQHPYTEGLLVAVPRNESRSGDLPTIPGTVPPPWEWPSGCHFKGRCAYADSACTEPVELRPHAGRLVRCTHAEDLHLAGVIEECS